MQRADIKRMTHDILENQVLEIVILSIKNLFNLKIRF